MKPYLDAREGLLLIILLWPWLPSRKVRMEFACQIVPAMTTLSLNLLKPIGWSFVYHVFLGIDYLLSCLPRSLPRYFALRHQMTV